MTDMGKSPAPRNSLFALVLCVNVAMIGIANAETRVVRVPFGNADELFAAIEDASTRPRLDHTIILVNGTYAISSAHAFPPIRSRITIEGGASMATLIPVEEDGGLGFDITENGALHLRNLEVSGFYLGILLFNKGELDLSQLQFSNNQSVIFCTRFGCRGTGALIYNDEGADFRMDRVSIIDSCAANPFTSWYASPGCVLSNRGSARVSNSQIYFSGASYEAPFENEGVLHISNFSVYSRNWYPNRSLIHSLTGNTEIENSVIAGYNADWCENTVSLGNNLVENPDCGFDSEDDLTGVPADLAWVPVEAEWNPEGREILTKALIPQAESAAVDTGSAQSCTTGSLLSDQRISLDGDGDGGVGCDRGAVERVPSTIDEGGINGLYFNPESDGHYVYIADTTYNTMVMWTTFDDRGDQAWIFGIGPRVGPTGSFVADAYINLNGKVGLNGTLVPAESVPWGTLEVRMDSCQRGRLIFDSGLPGFGSGQFSFERLAIVDQTGCVDAR